MNRRNPIVWKLLGAGSLLGTCWLGWGCTSAQQPASTAVVTPTVDPSPTPVTYRSEPEIKVRIVKHAATKEISGPGRLIVRPVSTTPTKSRVMTGPLTVTSGAEGVVVSDGKGGRVSWPFGTDVEILASDGTGEGVAMPSQSIRVDKKQYPGFLTIKPLWHESAAKFDVVATIPIESYLPGVLMGEIPKDFPRQSFEAQAIAARTYALHERARARAENRAVDVEATEMDQVFAGGLVTPMAAEAVRATRGTILVSEGKLLRAYFSSQCGGRPASAAQVWPKSEQYEFNKAKPLQGEPRQVFCQRAPLYRWEVSRSDDDVNRRIRAWGKANQHEVAGMTRVRSIEVSSRNDAERPNRYRLIDDRGNEYTLKAEELRMSLNQTVSGLPAITRENRVNSGDMEVEVWANQVRIRGRGWGHAVGMCQWCARGMAEAGMDWHSMLLEFYPGVEIVKAY